MDSPNLVLRPQNDGAFFAEPEMATSSRFSETSHSTINLNYIAADALCFVRAQVENELCDFLRGDPFREVSIWHGLLVCLCNDYTRCNGVGRNASPFCLLSNCLRECDNATLRYCIRTL